MIKLDSLAGTSVQTAPAPAKAPPGTKRRCNWTVAKELRLALQVEHDNAYQAGHGAKGKTWAGVAAKLSTDSEFQDCGRIDGEAAHKKWDELVARTRAQMSNSNERQTGRSEDEDELTQTVKRCLACVEELEEERQNIQAGKVKAEEIALEGNPNKRRKKSNNSQAGTNSASSSNSLNDEVQILERFIGSEEDRKERMALENRRLDIEEKKADAMMQQSSCMMKMIEYLMHSQGKMTDGHPVGDSKPSI